MISEKFNGKTPLERHRMVNQVLEEEFKNGLHALSLKLKPFDKKGF